MSELATVLDGLARQYSTVEARLIVTVVTVGTVVLLVWIAHSLRQRNEDGLRGAVVDLLVSVSLAFAVGVAGAIVLGVWGQVTSVSTMLAQSGIGTETFGRLVLTVALFLATAILVGFARRMIDEFLGHHDTVSQHQREVTYRVTQVSLFLTACIVALGVWDVNLSGLLIGAGFLGIIVGMAARQTIGAILAGFVLMFSRPFEVGDWIEIDEDEGIVTDITIINTRIQTFDGEYLMVPNDVVGASTVINRSHKGRLRLRIEVGIDYDADVEHAIEVAHDAIKELDEILRVPTPQVIATAFGDSAVLLEIRVWIDRPNSRRRWRAKQAVITSVKRAFKREGIKIPFPQRELSGREETDGLRLADSELRSRTNRAAESTAGDARPHTDGGGR